MKCSVDGCSRPVLAKGLCSAHYARNRRLGSPGAAAIETRGVPADERFWKLVDKRPALQCWSWLGRRDVGGYGVFTVNDTQRMKAHRFVWELLLGPIPAGFQLDHLCRVRHCVNPAHLEAVTQGDNIRRGVSFAAANAQKTHCPQNHPLSGDNLYVRPSDGARVCRTCVRGHVKKYQTRKRREG